MTLASPDPGSFRDPSGRIYTSGGRVLRAVMSAAAPAFEAARDVGLYESLIKRGLLVDMAEIDRTSIPTLSESSYVLEHPRLPFISYPYEWGFALHRRAALHHLEVHLAALDRGFTLSDATAYNIQFSGSKPIFIDHLSFRPYRDGEIWIGHRQFCEQFLNPIIFWSRLGVPPNHWFRGRLEGISPDDLALLLSWRDKLSFTILSHVTAQAAAQRRATRVGVKASRVRKARLSQNSFRAMLLELHRFINNSRVGRPKTVWSEYSAFNSYLDDEAAAKRAFICEMVSQTQPGLLLDLGCNSGDYSIAAIESGARTVVGFDYDHGALEVAAERAAAGNLPFLPLWLDAANPSPSQGWDEAERRGFGERAQADTVIALAFIHHVSIGRNIPFEMTLDWIMRMAPVGVIEFPPKSDPMVQQLLALREDIFPDYTEQNFLFQIGKRAAVVKTVQLSPGGRLLVWYDRTQKSR